MTARSGRYLLPLSVVLLVLPWTTRAAELNSPNTAKEEPGVRRWQTNYHGWTGAWVLNNGRVEAVIVPAIGRVMQFKFIEDPDGPLWENHALDGKQPNPKSSEWGNFGGDKTWPAQQEDWPKVTPRAWPPPPAFDSMPMEVETAGPGLRLISPVDPYYGIKTRRLVTLIPNRSEMEIETSYEKATGSPSTVGIWTITQCKDPLAVFLAPAPSTPWPEGYNRQSDSLPSNLERHGPLLSLTRDPKAAHKIGTVAKNVLWIGDKQALRISHTHALGLPYPDHGSDAEVYTNPDPLPYVELELLGPLHRLAVGDSIQELRRYILYHRERADPAAEAQALLTGN